MALSVVDTKEQAGTSPDIDWAAVQLAQFKHDEMYHREICRLSTQDRLRHMTLHFAKYAGSLQDEPDSKQFRRIAVDTLIIAVSCANILNVDLASALHGAHPPATAHAIFSRRLSIAAGKMAAACEKLDHLEDFPFRSTLRDETLAILRACIALFASEGWEPVREMTDRLLPIKGKSIFHGKL